ncbi:nitrate reductase [Tatumella morbirosei]|uniref:Nitrate reductase n=1 Tax=Tatumella morbirosei TaxID=642227 RepID=A0A095TDS3_9GAMM|nr:nitrate reductase [Tatumella morbirosei]
MPDATKVVADSSRLSNLDLIPVNRQQRTWKWFNFVSLWIGMVINISAWMLSSSLMNTGFSPLQAILLVLTGNIIILIPMILIGHAGAKFGIPFAVLARTSFGVSGAKLPAVLRALVACGWFGIQTWIGGNIIYTLFSHWISTGFLAGNIPFLGISIGHLVCFLTFWVIQIYFIFHGVDSIKKLETWTAPFKILMCFLLLWWMTEMAGGISHLFGQSSQFEKGGSKEGLFWYYFWPSLTAMVGYWATLALNIPDFTRFAKSQKDQIIGQALGLPGPMALLSMMSVMVTSATVVIYGHEIWDPIDLASNMTGIGVNITLLVLIIDTLCCNLAANMVGPAYDISSLWPEKISYKVGGIITAVAGVIIMPWKILESSNGFIFTWLVGYSALLGPIAGILMVDYFIIRKRAINVESLYLSFGEYRYFKGWNVYAVASFFISSSINIPGFLHASFPDDFNHVPSFFVSIYSYAWFIGLISASLLYYFFMKKRR